MAVPMLVNVVVEMVGRNILWPHTHADGSVGAPAVANGSLAGSSLVGAVAPELVLAVATTCGRAICAFLFHHRLRLLFLRCSPPPKTMTAQYDHALPWSDDVHARLVSSHHTGPTTLKHM